MCFRTSKWLGEADGGEQFPDIFPGIWRIRGERSHTFHFHPGHLRTELAAASSDNRRNTGRPCQDRGTCGVRRQTEPATAMQWALTRCPVRSGSGTRARSSCEYWQQRLCCRCPSPGHALSQRRPPRPRPGELWGGHIRGLVPCRDTKSTPLARLEQLDKSSSSRATCAISCSATARQV